MMKLKSLINFGELSKIGIGINVHFTDSGSVFSYCILKNKNEVLNLVEYGRNIKSINELHEKLYEHIANGVRIHVNFSGKGVLIKAVDKASEPSTATVQKLFPFILVRSEETTTQWYTGKANNFLTVTRENLFTPFERIGKEYVFYSYSIGPFILNSLGPLMSVNKIHVQNYKIDFINREIGNVVVEAIQNIEQSIIQIGEDKVEVDVLLSYASALDIFLHSSSLAISSNNRIERDHERFHYRSNLYKTSKIALLSTLLILFINSIAFFWLQAETNKIESRVSMIKGKSSEEMEMQSRFRLLSSSFQKLGWESNIIPVYYADQLAQTVPEKIQLSLMEIGALDEIRARQERTINFESNLIRIAGHSEDPLTLNQWIKSVENLDWVSKTSDQRYQYDSKTGKGSFEFMIQVK